MASNIIIMGTGRSGTSMIAGSIATAGQKYNLGGKTHEPDRFNEKGYFETNIVNRINDDILKSCPDFISTKGVWQGWLGILPRDTVLHSSKNIEDRIKEVVINQPFLLKDPRFSYTLPIWRPYLKDTKFICVFRHPVEFLQSVINNCENARYLQGIVIDKEFFAKIWLKTYSYILEQYFDLDIFYVNCNQFVKGFGAKELSDFVGHEINRNFVDKDLVHFSNNWNFNADDKSMAMYNSLNCKMIKQGKIDD